MARRDGPINPVHLNMIKAQDVMNAKPRTVTPETSIDELIERLLLQIEGCFPVINESKKLVGIVTESDVLHILQVPFKRAIVGPDTVRKLKKRMATKVEEIMTRDPITVSPDASLEDVLKVMSTHKLRHIPVVEKEKLVGLIGVRNIIEVYRLLR